MKFLLVSPRSGQEILAAEYRDFCVATGLDSTQLEQWPLFSTDAQLPDLDAYDGIFIGGSPLNVTDSSYDELQQHIHALLSELIESSLPTLFICFGTSYGAYACGGSVGRTHPEQSGPTIVELSPQAATDPLTQGLPQRFTALTGHTENVTEVGPTTTILATGPNCPVQIVRFNDSSWACQFHAEMDAVAMKNRMDFYFDYGYFSPEDYDSIVSILPDIDTTWAHQFLRNFIRYATAAKK